MLENINESGQSSETTHMVASIPLVSHQPPTNKPTQGTGPSDVSDPPVHTMPHVTSVPPTVKHLVGAGGPADLCRESDSDEPDPDMDDGLYSNKECRGRDTALQASGVVMPHSSKTLQEIGFTDATRTAFRCQEHVSGIKLPSFQSDGSFGDSLTIPRNARRGKVKWANEPGRERPALFNAHVLGALQRRGTDGLIHFTVYITNDVIDCMVLHQNGFVAVAKLPGMATDDAAELLKSLGVQEVRTLFSNDVPGRNKAMKLVQACQKRGVKASIRSFIGKKQGYSVYDEWQALKFDRKSFCAQMKNLPLAGADTLVEWKTNPEAGLLLSELQASPYELMTVEQLLKDPSPGFLVDQLIPVHSVGMLTAKHGSGKSALMIDLAACVATGKAWHGLEVTQGAVLYIFAEGGGGAGKRIQAWQTIYGLDKIEDFYLIREIVPVHESGAQFRLLESLRKSKKKFALIVIDTLVLCSTGLDENQAVDMSRFITALQMISQATGATVLVVHHENKSGEYRGSSALAAGVDTHLGITAGEGAAFIRLEVLKQKDFEPIDPLLFHRRKVEMLDCDGKPINSFIYDLGISGNGLQSMLTPTEQVVVQVLADITTRVTPNGAPNGALNAASIALGRDSNTNEAADDANDAGEADDAGQDADGTSENGVFLHGATATEWEKACCSSQKVSEATFARAKRQLIKLDAVECDHPGQRGARYLVSPDWRRFLAANAAGSTAPEEPKPSEPDDATESENSPD